MSGPVPCEIEVVIGMTRIRCATKHYPDNVSPTHHGYVEGKVEIGKGERVAVKTMIQWGHPLEMAR